MSAINKSSYAAFRFYFAPIPVYSYVWRLDFAEHILICLTFVLPNSILALSVFPRILESYTRACARNNSLDNAVLGLNKVLRNQNKYMFSDSIISLVVSFQLHLTTDCQWYITWLYNQKFQRPGLDTVSGFQLLTCITCKF